MLMCYDELISDIDMRFIRLLFNYITIKIIIIGNFNLFIVIVSCDFLFYILLLLY